MSTSAAAAPEEERWGWRAWTDAGLLSLLRDAGFEDVVLDHEPGTTFALATRHPDP